MSRIEVAVTAPLQHSLSYSCDIDKTGDPVGRRVLVPMGRQRITGYVLAVQPEEDVSFRILPVLKFLDTAPLFPENMVPFFRWIAEYYHFPLGEVIKTALPGGLTRRTRKVLQLSPKGEGLLKGWPCGQGAEPEWFVKLLEKSSLSAAATKKVLVDRTVHTLIKEWKHDGLVNVVDVLDKKAVGSRQEVCYSLNTSFPIPKSIEGERGKEELKSSASRKIDGEKLGVASVRTLVVLQQLQQEQGQEMVAARDIRRQYSGASKALLKLEKRGFIRAQQRRVYRNPFGETLAFFPEPEQLSDEQKQVLSVIETALEKKRYATFLLHGVTGCGKTEVYLKAAAKTIDSGHDVLVLVPEIALATQLEAHFVSRFGDQVVLLHSGLSQGERYDQWSLAATGMAKIVIGARSAVFAPLRDLGLIVVDEEHDSAYKQEDGLRYQGRDLAVLRAYLNEALVILGSGTPTISSYAACKSGKFELLQMTKRVEDRPLPEVHIVDLRKKEAKKRGDAIGVALQMEIESNLQRGKQSILLLNRRGFSSTYLCLDCGEPVYCSHCHVSLTYHKSKSRLVCHYCGFSMQENVICSGCRSHKLIPVGFGTERVEHEILEKFPDARVARIDSDTAGNRKKFLALLKQMHNREIDILIGTQMIAKGHDFPHVTLVGVVWADGGLSIPDFRAAERTYQLLSQVAGRAGRGEDPGRVIIQTLRPEHYAVQLARQHDYLSLYEKEMEIRRNPQFPPYLRMVNIKVSGTREGQVQATATRVAQLCRKASNKKAEVLGPAPSPIDRIRDRYRWQILLKGENRKVLHYICTEIIEHYSRLAKGDIRIGIDVDPESMM